VHERRPVLTATRSVRKLEDETSAGLLVGDGVLGRDAMVDTIEFNKTNRVAFLVLLHTTRDKSRILLEEHGELHLAQLGGKVTCKDCLGGFLCGIGFSRDCRWLGGSDVCHYIFCFLLC